MSVDEFHLKKQKTRYDYDRISSLPDDLLWRIMSLLPTKYAVATTVLSTRWKNLFASIPDVKFDDSLTRSVSTDIVPFCQFVTKVLHAVLTKLAYIRKFHLICKRGTYEPSLISSYISLVSLRNLEDFFVYVKSVTDLVPLPIQLFHCRSLKDLKLSGKFSLCVPNDVFFPSLKTLELSDLVLTDDISAMRFFHGCIVLEKLCLFGCVIDTISVLAVWIVSLKHLDLSDMNGDYAIFLNAPHLESLFCSSYATRGYYWNNLNSIVYANVNIVLKDEHFGDEKVSQLVNMVSNARSLSLHGDSLEPLIHQSATFPNLTKLCVNTESAGGWVSLPNILNNAPCLEVLHFDGGLLDEYNNVFDASSCLPERVPECVSAHLKELNIDYFHGEEDEFKLVEYFLKNGKVLEKMIINPALEYLPIFDMIENFPVTKRLLKLPRSSRACRIFFNDD